MTSKLIDQRVIFMGSPAFALPTLTALHHSTKLVGVVTQPDRPSGRGRKLHPPAVKEMAQNLGIPIIQPNSLKDAGAVQQLKDWQPDLIIVAAFGQILRKNVLSLPIKGCINVHASLLPKWRGAAPIQATILAGDSESGITIMQMDAGLDTGPIINQQIIKITDTENAGTLSEKLSQAGADLLIDTLPGYLADKLIAVAQDDDLSSYAPMLKKSDGELDFSQRAADLARKVRAYSPWPGTYAIIEGMSTKIHRASVLEIKTENAGILAVKNGFPAISGSDAWLLLEELQIPGKKAMRGDDFLRGNRKWQGSVNIHSSKKKS